MGWALANVAVSMQARLTPLLSNDCLHLGQSRLPLHSLSTGG